MVLTWLAPDLLLFPLKSWGGRERGAVWGYYGLWKEKKNKTKKLKFDPEALYSAVLVVTSLTVVSRIVKWNAPGPLFLSLFNHEELFFSCSLKTVVFTKILDNSFTPYSCWNAKKKKKDWLLFNLSYNLSQPRSLFNCTRYGFLTTSAASNCDVITPFSCTVPLLLKSK